MPRQNLIDYFFEGIERRDRRLREQREVEMQRLAAERSTRALDIQSSQLEESRRSNLENERRMAMAQQVEAERRTEEAEHRKQQDLLQLMIQGAGKVRLLPEQEYQVLSQGPATPGVAPQISGQRVIPISEEEQLENAARLSSRTADLQREAIRKGNLKILQDNPEFAKTLNPIERAQFAIAPDKFFGDESAEKTWVRGLKEQYKEDPQGLTKVLGSYLIARQQTRMTPWQTTQLQGMDVAGKYLEEAAKTVFQKYSLTSPTQVTSRHREEIEAVATMLAIQSGDDPRLIPIALRGIGGVSPGTGGRQSRLAEMLGGAGAPAPTPVAPTTTKPTKPRLLTSDDLEEEEYRKFLEAEQAKRGGVSPDIMQQVQQRLNELEVEKEKKKKVTKGLTPIQHGLKVRVVR